VEQHRHSDDDFSHVAMETEHINPATNMPGMESITTENSNTKGHTMANLVDYLHLTQVTVL